MKANRDEETVMVFLFPSMEWHPYADKVLSNPYLPLKSFLFIGSNKLLWWMLISSSSSSSSSNVKNCTRDRLWEQCKPLIRNQLGCTKAAHVRINVATLKNAAILFSSLSLKGKDIFKPEIKNKNLSGTKFKEKSKRPLEWIPKLFCNKKYFTILM